MATRFYLVSGAEAAPISPTPDAGWEDTSLLTRVRLRTTQISEAMNTVTFTDSDLTNKDIFYRQAISFPLAAGQTITGSQALKGQMRALEAAPQCNQFMTFGLRIIASDGSTVRKTILAVTRDNVEINAAGGTLNNRQFTATSAATNYTTQNGDRLVLEIGTGGTPTATGHTSNLRFGDSAGSDLSEDDTSTTDNRPWFEMADTLTFDSEGGQPTMRRFGMTDRCRAPLSIGTEGVRFF